jgi:protein ImuB
MAMARRYLAIHFPHLPTDRIARLRYGNAWRLGVIGVPTQPGKHNAPLVITARINNALRLLYLNEAAETLGLVPGMGLADAKAAHPHIEVLQQEENADALLLRAIADWCDCYTPLVAIDQVAPESFGLTLDITGCAHLFGGERNLMNHLLARLYNLGFDATASIAHTPGAAWAFARYRLLKRDRTDSETVFDPCLARQALTTLPLAALRLAADQVANLARLGLRTIGQLHNRPRAPIARRFGREVLLRLDQAFGEIEEAISPLRPIPELISERRFAEPLVRETDIISATLRLAGHLCESLEKQGKGASRLQLALYRIDGKVFRLDVGTSRPQRDPHLFARLFGERLTALKEEFDAGYGFEILRLSALFCDSIGEKDVSFLEADDNSNADHLVDRLAARLGEDCIFHTRLVNSHLPEQAECRVTVSANKATAVEPLSPLPGRIHQVPLRPLRLFAMPEPVEAIAEVPEGPPIRFRWRKVLHQVTRVEGPERIMDHWWAKQAPRLTRDYFRVEDTMGHRYWLFREGLYDRETAAPRWFLHGLFA